MAKTETVLDELKINYLSEAQYNAAKTAGLINDNELYMTPSSGTPGGGGTGAIPDWDAEEGEDGYILNKPTIPASLSQLTGDSTHRVVTDAQITSWNNKSNFNGSYNSLTDKPTIPTIPSDVSAFNNDSGYITSDDVPTALSQLTADSTHRVVTDTQIQSWNNKSNFSGSYADLTNKPTKVSDFTNDSKFITNAVNDLTNYYKKTETYTQAEVNDLISAIPKFAIQVVSSLPTSNISTTTVYLVKTGTETQNLYTEYIYVDSKWEKLGEQKVSLSGYATESWVEGKGYLTEHQSLSAYRTSADQDVIDSGKVDKVTGKGLSTNDYDATAKSKVDAIPSNPKYTDTVYDDTVLAGRVTTIEGKESTWDSKQNAISDLETIRSGAALGATALQSYTETDPTVPSWAKQPNKPTYTASEVGALPSTTKVPTKTSDLLNDTFVSSEVDSSLAQRFVPEFSSSSNEWELLYTETTTADQTYVYKDNLKQCREIMIVGTGLFRSAGSTSAVYVSYKTGGDLPSGVSGGGFINTSSYPAKTVCHMEVVGGVCYCQINGANSAGNSANSGASGVISNFSGDYITSVLFSLSGYGSNKMGAGAVIKIFGR